MMEDIPPLTQRAQAVEAELVRMRKRALKHKDNGREQAAIQAPKSLLEFDPVSLKEPETLHSWSWLTQGKWRWTRLFLVDDFLEVGVPA